MAEKTIIKFLEKNEINWFPIILDIEDTGKKDEFGYTKFNKNLMPIQHKLYNNSRPSYKELQDSELCRKRQKLIKKNNFDFNAIWIDTSFIYQIDIDTPTPKICNLNTLKEEAPYFMSMTKPYGYHFFMKVDDFDTKSKNKYIFKDDPYVDFLCGQGSYCKIDAEVFNGFQKVTLNRDGDCRYSPKRLPTIKTGGFCELLKNYNIDKNDKDYINKSIEYNDEKFWDYANLLTNDVLKIREHWFEFMCVAKNLNINYNLVDEFCEKFDGYNHSTNYQTWMSINRNQGFGWKKLYQLIKMCANPMDKKNLDIKYKDLSFTLPRFDDDSIAQDFAKRYNKVFIYQDEVLYKFNGVYWKEDDKSRKLKDFIANEYYEELTNINHSIWEYRRKNTKDTDEIDESYKKNVEFINQLKKLTKRKTLVECIESYITNEDIKFDDKPHLFAFKNKIWDLVKGQFVKPEPLDYISMTCDYNYEDIYDLDDKIKSLDNFIKQILPNEDVRKCNLKLISTGLYGSNKLQKLIIWNGCGGNGKGVLNKLIQSTIGNYYQKACNSILVEKVKDSKSPNPERASLDKKRYVVFVEPDKDIPFNCGTIKEITGEKEISARHLYNTKKTKARLHGTIIVECNTKPKLLEYDNAMERRIMDIIFPSKFTDDKEDVDEDNNVYLMNRLYDTDEWREEYKIALFHYLQPYFKEIYNDGFNPKEPQSIKERNLKYLSESNNTYKWFTTLFDKEDNYKYLVKIDEPKGEDYVSIKDIYNIYKHSTYFTHLHKQEKRDTNLNKFIEDITTIREIRKYYKERHTYTLNGKKKDIRNVIVGFTLQTNNIIKDNDSDDEL